MEDKQVFRVTITGYRAADETLLVIATNMAEALGFAQGKTKDSIDEEVRVKSLGYVATPSTQTPTTK